MPWKIRNRSWPTGLGPAIRKLGQFEGFHDAETQLYPTSLVRGQAPDEAYQEWQLQLPSQPLH